MKRKDGRYVDYVFLGKADGKEKRKYIYGRTPQELKRKKLDIEIDLKTGKFVHEKIQLKDWIKKWLAKKGGRSDRTLEMYEGVIDRHILPELGEMYLTDIKIYHVQDLINKFQDRPRTAEIIVMTLSQIFSYALLSELMIRNPADKSAIDLPSRHASKKRVITPTENKAILEADLTVRERAFVTLCLECGLRRSEALAVMKQDIVKDKLHVRKAIQKDGTIVPFGKSDRATREIPLTETAQRALKAVKSKMYLITTTKDKPLTEGQYRRMWDQIKYKLNKAAGGKGEIDKSRKYILTISAIGKDLSAHILRHTFATRLAENGYSPAEIQYLMGHATAALALEVYTHIEKQSIPALDKRNGVKTVSNSENKKVSEK